MDQPRPHVGLAVIGSGSDSGSGHPTARKIGMIGSLPVEFGGEGRGGVAVHTGKLAQALARAGESVTVIASDARHANDPGAFARPFGVAAHANPSKVSALRFLLNVNQLRRVPAPTHPATLTWQQAVWIRVLGQMYLEILQGVSPDIVHVHGIGMTALAVRRSLARLRRPLVVTMHSLRGHVPDEMFFARSVPSLFAADALIAVSRHLKTEAMSYGVAEKKIHVIPNGVDRTIFAPMPREAARRELGIAPDLRVVLLVGHLIERKGADIAIAAMRDVVARVPAARLYLIGAPQDYTDTAWLERVRAMPRELGIHNEIIFLGELPTHTDGKLNLWYNAADLLVLPSRAEGMGMVLTEAMACERPVIGARVGGIPDVIIDGTTGRLVPPEDPANLAAAIVEILSDADLSTRMGKAAAKYVAREHDWDQIARRTQEVYSRVQAPDYPAEAERAVRRG